jgi:VWFA-related protein
MRNGAADVRARPAWRGDKIMTRSSHLRLSVVFAVTACTPVHADQQSPAPADGLVFRASTELIRLDVSVTDVDGHPVADLQAGDFEIFQDGKRQPVQFADFRTGGSTSTSTGRASTSPGLAATAAPRGDAALASETAARRLVFIVDEVQMSFESVAYARKALETILDSGLQANDQVMIVGSRDRGASPVTFTTDPALLRRRIESIHWEADEHLRPGEDSRGFALNLRRLGCQRPGLAEDTMDPGFTYAALGEVSSLVNGLRHYPGRKAVFLLTDGFDFPCPDYRASYDERLRRLSDLAGRSSVVIYGLHTRPFSSGVGMPEQRATSADIRGPIQVDHLRVDGRVSDGLRRLAEPTGGFAKRSNSPQELIAGALADQGSYYTLAYHPPPGTFVGKKLRYRTIKVVVNRKEVRVRTRAGFYSVTDEDVLLRQ